MGCHLSRQTHWPSSIYNCHERGMGQWQPWLSGASRRSTQPSTNATNSHRWPSNWQALWWQRLIVLERTGLLSQTGHWGSQVVLLPAATPVCRSAMGKCLCSVGNNERHHSPFSFPFLTFFPFFGGGGGH